MFFRYDPVFMTSAEIRQDPEMEGPRTLENPGKIYYIGDYLLINELQEGIHLYDNSDPEAPVALSFLRIPGNVDMAVRGHVLYADNYIDLLAIDISDPVNPRLLSRSEDVFPGFGFDAARGFLVQYEETQVVQEEDCGGFSGSIFWENEALFMAADMVQASAAERASAVSNAAGIGGSMARFTLADGFLYTVDQSSLHVFDLSAPAQPSKVNTVHFGWGIETIYPSENFLFAGGQSGMYILDNSEPAAPYLRSVFQHATACDPVVVDGDIAYVTLRDGQECQGFSNQLDVVDVSNVDMPQLMRSYPMHNPMGLSVLDKTLYLCENDEGLKVFDITDPMAIDDNFLAQIKGLQAYDVIALPAEQIALVVGRDGLFQYDISDRENIRQLSVIAVQANE